jgi:hypothetical protein
MAQNTDATTVEPLTEQDIAAAADGHSTETDELRAAVAKCIADLEEYAAEWADNEVPDGHSGFSEPTVIWSDDDHVCIYVSHGSFDGAVNVLTDHHGVDDQTASAVPWAFNEFARRHGASPSALGTMDAVVLPRTDAVDQIITERK